MPSDDQTNAYPEMVAQAEAAVRLVKDPELRRVAFEKILESLLGGASPQSASCKKKKTSRREAKSDTKKSAAKKTSSSGAQARRGPKARVAELIDDGFFDVQRTLADVKAELANRGFHIPQTSLSGPLQSLTRERRLRREKQTSGGKGAKTTYVYSNW